MSRTEGRGLYRNPSRRTKTIRAKLLASVGTLVDCQLLLAIDQHPVKLTDPQLLAQLLFLRQQITTTRYLVRPLHPPERFSMGRTHLLSGRNKQDFRNTLRMNKKQFDYVISRIKDSPPFQRIGKKPQRPIEDQPKISLSFLGHDGSRAGYAALGRDLGVSTGSAYGYTRRCILALCSLSDEVARWPSQGEKTEIKRTLGKGHFDHVIGAVDGTMLPLFQAPALGGDDFATRKSNFFIGLTAACDHQGVTHYWRSGYSGAVHDSAAYKSTPLHRRKEEYFQGEEHLIADSAYALTPTVIAAFKSKRLTPAQPRFNLRRQSSRVKIEHTFG